MSGAVVEQPELRDRIDSTCSRNCLPKIVDPFLPESLLAGFAK
jgi:hypothetical protein